MFYIKTSEPHNCEEGLEVWKQQKQKKLNCKYCLEVDLMFDDEHMTPGGKHVPLEQQQVKSISAVKGATIQIQK